MIEVIAEKVRAFVVGKFGSILKGIYDLALDIECRKNKQELKSAVKEYYQLLEN